MPKRIILLCTICFFICGICKSQNYRYIYYLDVNLLAVPKSKAVIIGKGFKDENRFQLDCYAVQNNALLMTWHFTDSTLAEMNGIFRSYYPDGSIEKEGNYINNLEEGQWQTWDTLALKTDSVIYKNGLPLVQATFGYYKNRTLAYFSIKDSLQDTYHTFTYSKNSVLTEEVFFKGQKGILKSYESAGIKTDSLYTREEMEAHFPGGDAGWRDYLRKNLNANIPADNNAPAGKYTVFIKFRVNKDGSLEDISTETYQGYGMDQEAIRVIKKGPKWIPATQYGRKVNAYRRQPVTFLLQY